jgi:glycosyltransferase involved in cell wall biosynthesis
VTIRVAYTLEQCWHRVPGGTATSAIGVARAIAAIDQNGGSAATSVELVGVSARHREAAPAELTAPIAMRSMTLPRRVLYESWHTLRRPRIERATGTIEVIHATGMAVPPRTVPLVVTVHDLAFVHYPQHATRNGLRFFRQSLELTRRDADLVLCPSEATRRDCIAAGIDAARVRVIPWGVDPAPAIDENRATSVLASHALHAGRYVLFVGTIEPRKNLAVLAAAFERLAPKHRDLTLALVGPAGWNEDLSALLGPMRDRVRVLGHVSRADLDVLYARAAVFCYPSLLEGFGMPVLEAMAAGAAVITSAGTATEEVAGDAGTLVDPHDPVALADAIERVVADEDHADTLRRAAVARAATFTWARAAQQTIDAYRSCTP